MSSPKVLFGFHAVGVRLKTAPTSIIEIYVDPTRRDARMKQFLARAREAGARLIEADGPRLAKLAGSAGHQGVAARTLEESMAIGWSVLRGLPASELHRLDDRQIREYLGASEGREAELA